MDKSILDKMQKGSVYAIIPARSGSKGIIDKNIRELNGYPLIAYSIAEAKLTKSIDRVIVSTDSERYAEIARKYGAEVPFIRPSEYSTDKSQDIDFMKHAVSWFGENENVIPEYWVHIRTTCPYRKPEIIDESITEIKKDSKATSLLSVCIPKRGLTPYKWLVMKDEYLASIFFDDPDQSNRPRQSYPVAYSRSVYSDIYKSEIIVSQEKLFGKKIVPFYTEETIDIDSIADFEDASNIKIMDEKVLAYLEEHK